MAGEKVQFSEHEYEIAAIYYWLIILVALGLVLLITAFMSFYTIESGENGVVVRLGKVNQVKEPGIHWKLPWGIDRLQRVKVDYQYSAEFGFYPPSSDSSAVPDKAFFLPEARLLTGDLKLIDLQWVVQYRIQDPVAYLFNVENPENAIRTVGLAAMRTAVGDYSFHEVFQTERRAIAEKARKYMQARFDLYKMGVTVQHVQLKEACPVLADPEVAPVEIAKPAEPGTAATPEPVGLPVDTTKTDTTRKTW